jgi:hypothetical protein
MPRLLHYLLNTAVALTMGSLSMSRASGGIIYSDFGAGDTYNLTAGPSVGGSAGAFGVNIIEGAAFTAGFTETLTEIDAPFFNQGWPGMFNLELHADNGSGEIGALLESFQNVGPATTAGGIFSVYSSLHPLLTAGNTYWLIATPADTSTAVYWNENSIPSYGTTYQDINGSVGYSTNSLLPTFRVLGASAVPEPSSLLLGLAGLVSGGA